MCSRSSRSTPTSWWFGLDQKPRPPTARLLPVERSVSGSRQLHGHGTTRSTSTEWSPIRTNRSPAMSLICGHPSGAVAFVGGKNGQQLGHGCTSARQLAPEPLGQAHARLDLQSADRYGLDVDAERDTQAAAEGHQFKRVSLGMLEGCVEGVLGVAQVVYDPARDVDAEPSEEFQGLHRAAHRKGEHDRDRIKAAIRELVGIVGYQILGSVDVVNDLGDEVGAAGVLLGG